MANIILTILSPILALWEAIKNQIYLVKMGNKLPGRPGLPLLGNVLEIGRNSEAVTKYLLEAQTQFGNVFRVFVGPLLCVATANQEDHENILSGHEYMRKGLMYEFLKPWLGTGLLISTGDKWKNRRRILTPAFHFKILDQFIAVFNNCGEEFVTQMRKRVGKGPVEIWKPVKLLTLDVICESTMGVKVNAQTDSDSKYVNAVTEIGSVVYEHILSPWLYPKFIFRFSSLGRRFKACLDILHSTTNKVIRERREELQKLGLWEGNTDIDELGRRRRVAFLDLLLLAARDGNLSDADIREEVDTFMFEGHDTTAGGIAFTLYILSLNEDVQEKIYEELKSTFDTSKPLEPTLSELAELKYTEMVVKESLRLCPPVPGVSREITSDYKLPSNGHIVPKGSELFTNFMMLHRNPDVFPDPERFDPERFSPDNAAGRNPYGYLPFSAGPRNCIGQRFAMLEMKSVIAKTVWNFHLRSDPEFVPVLLWEITMKTKNGLNVIFEERRRE